MEKGDGKMADEWGKAFIRVANQVVHSMQERSSHGTARGVEQAPIVKLVDMLLEHAVDMRASDVHIEPRKDALFFRYRIDGLLCECHGPLSAKLQSILISRLKIMAKMDTSEHQKPLDGHIVHIYKGKKLDFRVASMPVQHGEALVIRILNAGQELRAIEELGMTEENERLFRRLIHAPSGMLIVTGPMNSGKTTTLYAALQELNIPERHIMTLEDPVEQQVHGINQIEVHEKAGLTFATGLRSMLRMDADCIMIGEARDTETAQIAIRAALTGHLLLTTLHAKDSCNALFRLLEMGVRPYLLAATARGIIAQRLVRRLCPYCREVYEVMPDSAEGLFLKEHGARAGKYYRSVGCEKCRDTGFVGRLAIHEILALNEELHGEIMRGKSVEGFQRAALDHGLRTMVMDGCEKARQGLTTLQEVRRVLYGC